MKKTFKYILFALTAIILASCAVDEFWEGMDQHEGEEVVMTFKPKFEDFESVTKAIGDATQVDQLLVHVYEAGSDVLMEYTYDIYDTSIDGPVEIPFFYGKKYTVYFWAYKSGDDSPYTVSSTGLKGGVSVEYPEDDLGYDALESLDAFYAVADVDISKGKTMGVSLTRPFAQVNLVADKQELLDAQATKVEFKLKDVATSFIPGGAASVSADKTLVFTSTDKFQSNQVFSDGKVYLGTTYLFVPPAQKIYGELIIYSGDNVLKSASDVEIPLQSNRRTNLTFSGIVASVPDWDDDSDDVLPSAGTDGWIHISTPEQLAALLRTGVTSETKVHICKDLDMTRMPDDVKADILAGKSFTNLIIDGSHYSGTVDNHTVSSEPVDGEGFVISNLEAAAFLGNATNLNVSNLTLKNFHITNNASNETHVGTLVNTLKGTSTFKNVKVENSYASTVNGAAGGIVGYIARKSATDRAESMEVKFDGCSIKGSVQMHIAAGTLAEGKFVGLLNGYDNDEKLVFTDCTDDDNTTVADYASRYVEGNESAWQSGNDYSEYNGFLGDEKYLRAKVYFGGEDEATNRFCPKWDGTTTVEPLLANNTYDGANVSAAANRFAVYSPFDLAGVRKKTASPAAIYLKADVDMNGQGADGKFNVPSEFTQSKYSSTDDKVFDPFSYVTTLDGYRDASTNNSIYNLSIAQIQQERAAFVLYASGTTVHKNINFRNCQTVAVHIPVTTDAKAYGAILVSNVDATYTMENVHAYDCKVFALQKVGTLGARISGTSTLRNNSVNNCYVENYECKISERFSSGQKTIGSWTVTVYADFYPYGEVGGMYGFIQGSSTMTGCKVNGTTIYAFGQDDKMATVDGNFLARLGIAALGYYKVPGRHVSTLIGNIRATGNVTLTGCTVDANTKCTKRHDKHNSTYNYIGQAYIVKFVDSEGSVTVDGNKLTLADCNRNTRL